MLYLDNMFTKDKKNRCPTLAPIFFIFCNVFIRLRHYAIYEGDRFHVYRILRCQKSI